MKKNIFENILLSLKEGIVFINKENKIEFINNFAKKILYNKDIFEIISKNKNVFINKKNYEVRISKVFDENKKNIGKIILFTDIQEQVEKYKELKKLNYIDDLTKIYNRRYYEKKLIELNKKEFLPLTVVMMDVNNLKIINDVFKHNTGDKILINISKIIAKNIKSNHLFFRIGGDEFAILMSNTNEIDALNIINKIKLQIRKKKINNIRLSCSFGFKTKEKLIQKTNKVIELAEDYMYKSKFIESEDHKKEIINIISNELYNKKKNEKDNLKDISKMCEKFSKYLNLNKKQIKNIKLAGLLHDIGKIAVSKKLLNKKDLTENEKVEVKRHVEIGYNILRQSKEYFEIAEIVVSHHENYDGTGYPKKLKRKEIIIESRILSIIDEYFNLIEKYSLEETKLLLKKESNKRFDPVILKKFIKFLDNK